MNDHIVEKRQFAIATKNPALRLIAGINFTAVGAYAARMLSYGLGAREYDGMSGLGDLSSGDRRLRLIGKLVERYQSTPEPEKWLQDMTLQALRALDKSGLSPADKSPARREIHAIHREVASKARAAKLARRTSEIAAGDGGAAPIAAAR